MRRLLRFFNARVRRGLDSDPLAPIVFSWLAGRGSAATRLDPHDVPERTGARELARRLAALLRDERLFRERLEQC